jgi:Rps23 Pro-64 3,4-dihydroxylase Tpa1-like proline 4-hydroxylase
MFKYTTIKNFLSDSECDMIMEYGSENLSLSPGLVVDRVKNNSRKSSVSFTNFEGKFSFIKERISEHLNELISIKGHDINFSKDFQYTEYKVGEYYSWHKDSGDHPMVKDRFCSIVIQLNDEYGGGDLQMINEEDEVMTFEKGKGNLFVFLSNILHQVTPVENGVRYSLVSWFSLKPEEGYKKTLI